MLTTNVPPVRNPGAQVGSVINDPPGGRSR